MNIPRRSAKTIVLAALLAGASLGLASAQSAASAKPAKSDANQCFRPDEINGFNAPDDHTVYIRVGVNDFYKLDLMGDCIDLTFRQSLGIQRTPGMGWICSPLDATIVYRETGMPERCPVTGIHKLSAAEVAALPKRDRP
jgi:hypothetical protein